MVNTAFTDVNESKGLFKLDLVHVHVDGRGIILLFTESTNEIHELPFAANEL